MLLLLSSLSSNTSQPKCSQFFARYNLNVHMLIEMSHKPANDVQTMMCNSATVFTVGCRNEREEEEEGGHWER